eukprot:1131268-Alexandrium_andersonii.AAC.1
MSASLVGSEMCIRDSVPPTLPLARCGLMALDCVLHCWWARWRKAREAVSYTHLTLPTICSV